MHWVEGIDCGEQAFRQSAHDTEEAFFREEIERRVWGSLPGTVVVFDDAREIVAAHLVRHLIDKILRVGRHSALSCFSILHNLKSGSWSTQAYSSCKYLTVFPRTGRAKLVQFLNKDLGIPLARSRDHVYRFAQAGRRLTVSFHAPECLIGEKLLRLL